MHVFDIEKLLLHRPHFMEYLGPLCTWVYLYFKIVEIQFSALWRRLLSGIDDVKVITGCVEHFFAIGTDTEAAARILNKRSVFQFLQIIYTDGSTPLINQQISHRTI